ncbi:3-methyladenine DNA glycosylase [Phytohabitans rumicis]|uniref:3-methyladenine DNA glycosylase n=1 Tax=Phytohabitans rumicis TaxID=1076125 RepID=A0A6V8L4T0_9ACTN|nr:3-methyladenine DNA glycosylase [Phytohabitans rumicis]GFJ89136.1 hypothetical protein Prum_027780 [Phytohabitans rumicis]
MLVLDEAVWKARRAAHERRVDAWIAPHLERRRAGIKHPVEDFLFTYYSFRPAQLRRWHPGAGVILENGEVLESSEQVTLNTQWIKTLLEQTAKRPAHFGCFGMHEWAMVYRADGVRHGQVPLRLSPAETARVVESNRVRCSHFDAFRFFTPPARPLNQLSPTRETQHENEQPGCLHANMDLYKWAYKLSPLVESELVADAFALARDIRALDMRASPYDLAELGYPPVRVETPQGKSEYASAQRAFAERAAPIRLRLIEAISRLDGSS